MNGGEFYCVLYRESPLLEVPLYYQLFIIVGSEIPHVYGAALVPHNQCGLVRMEAHAVNGSLRLKQALALLCVNPVGEPDKIFDSGNWKVQV